MEGIDHVCDILSEISRNTNLRLETLANRIGYGRDLGNTRKEVYEKLRNLPELSKTEKFTVCEMICKQVEDLRSFWDYLKKIVEIMWCAYSANNRSSS